ncbi:MAG: ribonuclease P protein component [Mycoplasma sp.]|nr:ribonuclease P protein component [Mycoplasma sp.]
MKNKYMLRSKKDFETLFKKKTSYYSSFYNIHFVRNDINHIRVAISVSKKIAKLAVVRNKARRQIKSILSDLINYEKNIDCLIVLKVNFFSGNFKEKQKQLKELLNKVSIIKNAG